MKTIKTVNSIHCLTQVIRCEKKLVYVRRTRPLLIALTLLLGTLCMASAEKFIDVELSDPSGKKHKLSEYVGHGKPVLLDFWASWCMPCRREMPEMVELYATYKGKFEIVGISLDRSVDAWQKAIADLHITWPQLSDLKLWNNEAAVLYKVRSIPHFILVGADGTILAAGIHGEKLRAKIAEALKQPVVPKE